MKSRVHQLLIASALSALLVAFGSCASSRLYLDSAPQNAEIFAVPKPGDPGTRLGVTPLTIDAADATKAAGTSGPLYLEFRKDRHNTARAFVTDISATDLKMTLSLTPESGLENQERLNTLVDQVFESQRLALTGRFDEAIRRLKEVQKEAPQLAAAYEIEGGVYVLQKKLNDALDSYRMAARINPANPSNIRMRNYLEAKLGVGAEPTRQPANAVSSASSAPATAPPTVPATAPNAGEASAP